MIFLETIRKVIFKYYSILSWNGIELVQIMSKVIFVISFLLLLLDTKSLETGKTDPQSDSADSSFMKWK